jgi:thymidylate synthase (FAD)
LNNVPSSEPWLDDLASKIVQVPDEDLNRDVMEGASRWHLPIGPHGHVSLVDVMPRLVPRDRFCDYRIVQAARTSYGSGAKSLTEDEKLIRYLLRHRHTSPAEMVRFLFHVKAPMFVARQWVRHRMCSWNEVSGRYTEMPNDFWMPSEWRGQDTVNKQGSDGTVSYSPGSYGDVKRGDDGLEVVTMHGLAESTAFAEYHRRIDAGVSREMARTCLPLSTSTEWYWLIDAHNLMHFLSLRMDSHAQKEIQDYGRGIYALIRKLIPATIQAFEDFHPSMGAMHLTLPEIETIKCGEYPSRMTSREKVELDAKCLALGIPLIQPSTVEAH